MLQTEREEERYAPILQTCRKCCRRTLRNCLPFLVPSGQDFGKMPVPATSKGKLCFLLLGTIPASSWNI